MSGYNDDNPDDLPADEFGNEDQFDDQSFDEDATTDDMGDDGWDDQAVDGDDDQSDRPQKAAKKKSGLIFYVIIGVVVLAGLGFVVMQLGGGSAAPEQAQAPADPSATTADGTTPAPVDPAVDTAAVPVDPAATAPVPDAAAPAPAEPAPKGFMNGDPVPATEPVPSLPAAPALTAVESTTTPPAEDLPAPAPVAAQTPEDPAVIGGLKPVSDFPSVDQIKKAPSETAPAPIAATEPAPEPAAALPVPSTPEAAPVETVAPVPAPVAATPETPAVNAAELTVLQGKLDAALAKIDGLEKDVAAAKAAPAPAADTSKVEALEEKISRLEQQLEDKTVALTKAQDQAKQTNDRVAAPSVSSAPPVEVERPAPARVSKPAPVTPSVARVSWELRGAQPGKAMISRKGSSGDVRSVAVGDTVPGLGTIRSIEQTSAGWTVRGTLGQVTQ